MYRLNPGQPFQIRQYSQTEDETDFQQGNQGKVNQEENIQYVQDSSAYPFNSIGEIRSYLRVKNHNNKILKRDHKKLNLQKIGIGTLVSYGLVVTSAHNIYFSQHQGQQGISDQIYFYPSYSNSKNNTNNQKQGYKIRLSWLNYEYFNRLNKKTLSECDMVFLQLETNQFQQKKQYLTFNTNYQLGNNRKDLLMIPGFIKLIQDKKFNCNHPVPVKNNLKQSDIYYEQGYSYEQRGYILKYRINTVQGQSGAPVLLKRIQNNRISYEMIGIHKGQHSHKGFCVLMSSLTKQQYKKIYSLMIQRHKLQNNEGWKNIYEPSIDFLKLQKIKLLKNIEQLNQTNNKHVKYNQRLQSYNKELKENNKVLKNQLKENKILKIQHQKQIQKLRQENDLLRDQTSRLREQNHELKQQLEKYFKNCNEINKSRTSQLFESIKLEQELKESNFLVLENVKSLQSDDSLQNQNQTQLFKQIIQQYRVRQVSSQNLIQQLNSKLNQSTKMIYYLKKILNRIQIEYITYDKIKQQKQRQWIPFLSKINKQEYKKIFRQLFDYF